MSSFSTFASGSRAAPRDASDRTGRRPKSVYMDERQFRTVDDDFEEEAPPKKTGALESKDRDYHIKAVHRSFATPASARQSARKAVDEIVLGDEERRFKQRLNQELDADRIARLREMNKKRLDALEKKLADLQRQKEEQDGEHVPAPSDGEDVYRPSNYAGDESPEQKPRRTAWQEQSAEREAKESAAPARPKLTAQIPEEFGGLRGAADAGAAVGADDSGAVELGYTSDPGAPRGRRVSTDPARASMSAARPRASSARGRKSVAKHEPFSFITRVQKKSIQARRMDDEMLARMEMEEQEYNRVFVAKPPPKTTTEKLYEKMIEDQKKRSEENRRQSKERLGEQERPFRFWVKAKSQEEYHKRKLREEIERIQEELKHYGVKEQRMKSIQTSAWDATQTDFTEAEQEEFRMLARKKDVAERTRQSLSDAEQARFAALAAENDKKLNSTVYIEELLRALQEELHKQQTAFRSVPVPAHVRQDFSQKLQDEERMRKFRKEERKNKLASMSSLPRRMKEHEKQHGAQQASKKKDGPGDEYTFKPKIKGTVPDFKQLHAQFKLELQDKKASQQAARAKPKPVFLRTEWFRLDQLRAHERAYRAQPVSKRVAAQKLQPLNLPAGATQWDLIEALASSSTSASGSGLTLSELREFRITSPSQLEILGSIDKDIRKLRDTRWPYTLGGRVPPQPTPNDATGAARAHKSPKKTLAHTLRQEATRKAMKEREEAKKRREEEVQAQRERREKERVREKTRQLIKDREAKQGKAADNIKKLKQEFRDMDNVWKAKVEDKIAKVNARGLLMEDITQQLRKQATDAFRKHLKDKGLEALADELEMANVA